MPAHRNVARARLGEVTDRQLGQLASLAHAAPRGNVTPAEAEYLLTACGPLLDELIERRRVDQQIAAMFAAGSARVVPIRGEGA